MKLQLTAALLFLASCASSENSKVQASAADEANAPTIATVGLVAPDFTLIDQNGTQHSLSDFEGSPVVLEWFNHGCPFVKKFYSQGDMPAMQARFTDQEVVWLSICSSAEGQQGYFMPEEATNVVEQHDMSSTALLRDADGSVGRLYGAKTTPHMFVIDATGVLVYDGAIDSVNSTDPADIADATNHVAETLDALLAGETIEPRKTQSYGCSVKYAK